MSLINLQDMIKNPKTFTMSEAKNVRCKAVKGCGKSIANIGMMGSASTDLRRPTEGASSPPNVTSGQAVVSSIQPEVPDAAGYQWVQLAW